jgi:Putative DNA-binding domain
MDLPWEDYLLERKTEGDLRDLLKTMVAFANSVRPEHKAVILIGEKDDGSVKGVTNPDNIQKKIREEAEKIYPAIIWSSQVYEKDSLFCVRVEIEYSGETPHFGGIAWVRKGSETVKATDEVFQKLIDLRSNKVQELAKWLNRTIAIRADESLKILHSRSGVNLNMLRPKEFWEFPDFWVFPAEVKLIDVNRFWITVESRKKKHSVPIEKLILNFDDEKEYLLITVIA